MLGFLRSWRVGRLAGIDVQIHWTFLLLPVWIYFSSLAAGSGAAAASVAVLLLLAVFGCVVLHELGHSLMARKFGIGTRSITLLPIGGVASLERMPRNPWQELAIAVAGPAVNVVIATILFFSLPILSLTGLLPVAAMNFLATLAWVNVALVVFNMLPAFPMDGGRVLRAGLAIGLPYPLATRIAARVGQFAALALGLIGMLTGNWMLVLLAAFVFLAARGETLMVDKEMGTANATPRNQATAMLLDAAGNEVAPVSWRALPVVSAQWNAGNALGWLSSESVEEFLVSSHGVVIGAVRKCDLRKVVQAGMGALPIERLLSGQFLPFRDLRSA